MLGVPALAIHCLAKPSTRIFGIALLLLTAAIWLVVGLCALPEILSK